MAQARNHEGEQEFDWKPQPRAAAWLGEVIARAEIDNPGIAAFSRRLLHETGTRLVDWLDEVAVEGTLELLTDLESCGFTRRNGAGGTSYWRHPGGLFPWVRLHGAPRTTLFLKVDSVVDFLMVHGLVHHPIEGELGASIRQALAIAGSNAELFVREKHDSVLETPRTVQPAAIEHHRQAFLLRPRHDLDPEIGFARCSELIASARADLGDSYACDLFFRAERRYWAARSLAGRWQKARQDALGLGFANHDHHTYRSSRECFKALIRTLEALGLHCRERFYAGTQAGWGAQVMEHEVLGVAVFADVDLSPDEVTGDFAHSGLQAKDKLGTVGLWCRLHGEAFLAAGMHHLECQFDFDAVTAQLARQGISCMPPFTNFPYLKQAFTQGEHWPIDPRRLDALLTAGQISNVQAESFRAHGALGSHLEILERNHGYKGFNQTGISDIISRTDPRRADAQVWK
jgi:hypothetical protein